MLFRQLFDTDTSTYTYLVGDERTHEAVVIDPVLERVDEVLAAAEELGLTIVWSMETHVHADHVTAGGTLRERMGIRVAFPARANGCGCADLTLADGDEVRVGDVVLMVLETPGHTSDSVSFLIPGKMIFTGDALLVGTCGRTDFQNGDPGALYDSIHGKLFPLADDVVVWPGHDYAGQTRTTIGAERTGNKRAAGRTRDEFIALMRSLSLPRPRRMDEAVPANLRCGIGDVPHTAG